MGEQTGAYKVALTAGTDTAGGVLSLLNPEGADVIVTRLVIDITTVATAACTLDAGIGSGATTLYDNLIDGKDVNGATGSFDNLTDAGSNGKARQRWESDGYLTISTASGASAGLVGYAYVQYIRV